MRHLLAAMAVGCVLVGCQRLQQPSAAECSSAVDNRLRIESVIEAGKEHPLMGRALAAVAPAIASAAGVREQLLQSCMARPRSEATCAGIATTMDELEQCAK